MRSNTDEKSVESPWTSLLRRAMRNEKRLEASSLIVVGDKENGKSTLLNKLSDRMAMDELQNHAHSSTKFIDIAPKVLVVNEAALNMMNNKGNIADANSMSRFNGSNPAGGEATGDAGDGIRQGKRSDLDSANSRVEYALDYSYINVKNRFSADKDDVLARMNVWQVDNTSHVSLIPDFVQRTGLRNTAFVITLNLSEPTTVEDSLKQWFHVLDETCSALLSEMDPDEASKLKKRISKDLALYVDPSIQSRAALNLIMTSEAEANIVGFDHSLPADNLGVPVIVVGCKTDVLARTLAKSGAGADDRFDFLVRKLRAMCLQYGATLLFSSAAGDGISLQLLQDYIFHRLYSFPLQTAAKVICNTEDPYIFVPTGYDSADLLATTSSSSVSKLWSDTTHLKEIFQTESATPRVFLDSKALSAVDNNSFLKQMKDTLERGRRSGGGVSSRTLATKLSMAGVVGQVLPKRTAAGMTDAPLDGGDDRSAQGTADVSNHGNQDNDGNFNGNNEHAHGYNAIENNSNSSSNKRSTSASVERPLETHREAAPVSSPASVDEACANSNAPSAGPSGGASVGVKKKSERQTVAVAKDFFKNLLGAPRNS